MNFTEKLNQLQSTNYISPVVLAKLLGYKSRQSVYKFFNGKKINVTTKQVERLAMAYGVDKDYFSTTNNAANYQPAQSISKIKNKAEKLAYLISENHSLWHENSLLKRQIIELKAKNNS